MYDPTPVLPFPAPETPVEQHRGRHVEVTPAVGYRAVTLTYYDAEHIPRISVTLDETVPQEMTTWLRSVVQRMGDGLPPRVPSRPPLFALHVLR